MASDIVLGIVLGVILVGAFNPMKGILFIIMEQRKQIAFLRAKNGDGESGETYDSQNRETLAEKRP